MPLSAEFARSATEIEVLVVGILIVTFGTLLARLIEAGVRAAFGKGKW